VFNSRLSAEVAVAVEGSRKGRNGEIACWMEGSGVERDGATWQFSSME
jgi:hypothetical protein